MSFWSEKEGLVRNAHVAVGQVGQHGRLDKLVMLSECKVTYLLHIIIIIVIIMNYSGLGCMACSYYLLHFLTIKLKDTF
jgi:hypothetical protein